MRDLLGVVSAKELLRVLKPLRAVQPNRSRLTLPVLGLIRVEAAPEAGGLWLEATDLDVRLAMLASGNVEAGARAAMIRPKRTAKLLRHWPGRDVTLDVGKEDVGLTGPGIRARLRSDIQADEFPSNLPGWEWEASVPWGPLRRMAGKTMWACSTEESRPILNGVYWRQKDGHAAFCGTNGHRLACMDSDDLSDVSLPDFEIIVPPGFWRTAFQVFGKEDEALTMKGSGSFIALESPTARLHTRLIEGRYPNYRQVFPSKDKDRVRVSVAKNELMEAAKRADAVASDQTHRMIAEIEGDHLTLRVWTPDIGELVQVVGAEVAVSNDFGGFSAYDFENGWAKDPNVQRIGVNVEYLMEVLRYTSGPTVDLAFTAAERAIEVASEEDSGWQALVMPLRLIDAYDATLLEEPPLEELADAEEETVPA